MSAVLCWRCMAPIYGAAACVCDLHLRVRGINHQAHVPTSSGAWLHSGAAPPVRSIHTDTLPLAHSCQVRKTSSSVGIPSHRAHQPGKVFITVDLDLGSLSSPWLAPSDWLTCPRHNTLWPGCACLWLLLWVHFMITHMVSNVSRTALCCAKVNACGH